MRPAGFHLAGIVGGIVGLKLHVGHAGLFAGALHAHRLAQCLVGDLHVETLFGFLFEQLAFLVPDIAGTGAAAVSNMKASIRFSSVMTRTQKSARQERKDPCA